jgi:hypothetical protein
MTMEVRPLRHLEQLILSRILSLAFRNSGSEAESLEDSI